MHQVNSVSTIMREAMELLEYVGLGLPIAAIVRYDVHSLSLPGCMQFLQELT